MHQRLDSTLYHMQYDNTIVITNCIVIHESQLCSELTTYCTETRQYQSQQH